MAAFLRNPAISLTALVFVGIASVRADESPKPAADTATARNIVESATAARLKIEREVALRAGDLKTTQSRIEALTKQLAEANARAATEASKVEQSKQALSDAETRLQEAVAVLNRHMEADRLRTVAGASQHRFAQAVEALDDSGKKLAELEARLDETKRETTNLTRTVEALQKQIPTAEEELRKATEASTQAETALAIARTALGAEEKAVTSVAEQLAQSKAVQERSAAAAAKTLAAANDVTMAITSLTEASKLSGDDLKAEIEGLQAQVTRLTKLSENAGTLSTETAKVVANLDAAMRTAEEKRMAAATTHEVAVATLTAAKATQQKSADSVGSLKSQLADASKGVESTTKLTSTLSAQIAAYRPTLQQLQANIALLAEQNTRDQQTAQKASLALGRFVSFRDQVAPILVDRCMACHNDRTNKGDLDLSSFASLLRGGESGSTVVPENAEESLLWTMVHDHSMPKDADPLPDDQVELIRHWITLGAEMDAGVDVADRLFDIIPARQQPLPPDTYRVPIPVTAVAFSPDGSILASSGYHEVLLWSTAENKLTRRITNIAERVYDLEFSPDGSALFVAAGTPGMLGEVKSFKVDDGSLIHSYLRTTDAVFAVAISGSGSLLATAAADRTVRVFHIASGEEQLRLEDHSDWVMDVAWSPDDASIVSASRDKTVRVVQAATGEQIATFTEHGQPVYAARFLPDGKQVISAGSDRKLRVWQVDDLKEVRAISGFGNDIFKVEIAQDGTVFTACADHNARGHNASDGKALRTFAGHGDWVYTLALHPGKSLLATGCYDGEIRLWNANDGTMQTSFIAVPENMPVDKNVAASK